MTTPRHPSSASPTAAACRDIDVRRRIRNSDYSLSLFYRLHCSACCCRTTSLPWPPITLYSISGFHAATLYMKSAFSNVFAP